MTVTSGRRCSELSEKLRLLGYSVRTYLESCDLPRGEWSRIWSVKGITSSCLILKLRLSELRTGENVSHLWPTAVAQDAGGLAGAKSSQIKQGSRHSLTLSHAVLLPTPTVSEAEHGGPNSTYGNGSARLTGAAMLWRTPCAQDGGGRAGYADSAKLRAYIERGHQPYLTDIVKHPDMTPSCADVKSAGASSGQLNPTWVEWLMGFPIGWTDLDA